MFVFQAEPKHTPPAHRKTVGITSVAWTLNITSEATLCLSPGVQFVTMLAEQAGALEMGNIGEVREKDGAAGPRIANIN